MSQPLPPPFFAPPAPQGPLGAASRPDDDDHDDRVRTQMVGESPGDDLGYDPATIPVEKIPDDDDDDELENDSEEQ